MILIESVQLQSTRLHALDVMTQLVTSGQLIKTLARSCRGHLDIAGAGNFYMVSLLETCWDII